MRKDDAKEVAWAAEEDAKQIENDITAMCKDAAFYLVAILVAGAFADSVVAQVNARPSIPHLRVIEHQRMMLGDKVVYEKDVDRLDMSRQDLAVDLSVDGLRKSVAGIADSISVDRSGTDDGFGNLLKGYMISFVVTDVTPAGRGTLKLLYTLRDPAHSEDKSGYVSTDVTFGRSYVRTEADGTRIAFTVRTRP